MVLVSFSLKVTVYMREVNYKYLLATVPYPVLATSCQYMSRAENKQEVSADFKMVDSLNTESISIMCIHGPLLSYSMTKLMHGGIDKHIF